MKATIISRLPRLLSIALAITAGTVFTAMVAEARITKIEITSTESPTFGGTTFGTVGAYEKLRGRAYGAVDPADPLNALITDIELAPTNAGKVEYSMDIYILKPVNLSQGNNKLFMEVNNRGNKLFGGFNGSGGGNNPTSATDAGQAFLMKQGYSIAWNGWDISASSGGDRLTITVPVATNGGVTITGPSYEYIVFDNSTTLTSTLAYAAATLDKSQATLTVRQHLTDPAVTIPATGWEYTSAAGTAIRLLPAGTAFQQSAIYEFSYTAKDPLVAGLGLAATRDFVSFLRHATQDDFGTPNPLAGHVDQTYAFTVSQPARYLNDFETLGFNEDEQGRRVFDGILNWIGAGTGVAINFRFAQTARTERNRQNHRYPEGNFPFAYPLLTDPYTGKTGGRGVRCAEAGTCPKALQVNSANEYWVKTGSLLHTDPLGKDLHPDPDNVRFFLLSSLEHTVSGAPPLSAGICQQFRNPTDPNPALRALFVALDEWVAADVEPPNSEVPNKATAVYSIPVSDGVGIIPQQALGFPDIPGVTYTGVITVRHLFDFGPLFDDGIMTINPPDFSGPVYPSFVSKVDKDGNDIAGIRLPPVEVPIATTTGWGLRAAAFGGPDGCESSGQWIPFKTTKAERQAAGDPRLSLEERYKNHDNYVKEVAKAAEHLEKRRFLLPADVQRYIDQAQASNVLQ
ncbi:MAG TPA: alpha/beta hydrolase domain-containing protein [Casimicrobiaceae bacterium]|nr:alpha/beta hydrolase domain-containing protein [Casimicrobiaceae bacterium]